MKKHTILVNNLYENLNYSEDAITNAIEILDEFAKYDCPNGELSIAFMSDDMLADLHKDFFNDPSTTDVITFEGDEEENLAGEICISVDHALTAAQEYGTDLSYEMTLYLVHGYLHLAGFDDLADDTEPLMRAAEKKCLDILKKAGAMPNFHVNSENV